MSRRSLWISLAFALAFTVTGDADICTTHTYLGNNPDEGNPGWHEEVQGLGHDADFWYISQNPPIGVSFPAGTLFGGPALWRVPVTHDLGDGVSCGSGSVSCSRLIDTPLLAHGYNHYGDIDTYEFGGRSYLLVPIENGDLGPGLAIFRADATLAFLAFAPFPEQTHAGWVAVDPTGLLLSSEAASVPQFNRYYLDWAAFQATGETAFTLDLRAPILLQDESGAALELLAAQGGEYSDDGQLLYFSNGYGDFDQATWGVHVFETRAGSGAECGSAGDPCTIAHRVEHSHNGSGGFAFEFQHDTPFREEPEGLTFWDLDADGRAPGLRGQVHVVLLDNDLLTADDVYVKHYRLSLDDTTPPTIACPADTVAECSVHTGVPNGDPALALFFGGVSATDACDPAPVIGHNAPAVFDLGATPVTFTARDHASNLASCVAQVTVVDTLPPNVVCPAPVVVECTSPEGIAATDPQLASFFAGASAADVCDAAPVLANNAPDPIPLGTSPITFTADDAAGNARSCASAIRVADSTPPQIVVALSATTLWSPDHALVPITATVTVIDRCDPSVVVQLVSITSNEPDNGTGDGDTAGDIQGASVGTADVSFALRAERSGSGAGRVYTIVYRATDASGNASTATAYVQVPRSK
jgi:HYR domain